MNELIPLCIAVALLVYYNPISTKPLYKGTPVNINELTEWRQRLKLTVEMASELLGVPEDTLLGLESGKYDITKRTKLVILACELAYIAADQYIKANPSKLNNNGNKNRSEALGRQRIRGGIINEGKNVLKKPLSITLHPESLIHLNDTSAKQEKQNDF